MSKKTWYIIGAISLVGLIIYGYNKGWFSVTTPATNTNTEAGSRFITNDAPTLTEKMALNNLTLKLNAIQKTAFKNEQKLAMYQQAVSDAMAQNPSLNLKATSGTSSQAQDCICNANGSGAGQCWVWNGVIFFVQFCRRKCCESNNAIISNLSSNTMF